MTAENVRTVLTALAKRLIDDPDTTVAELKLRKRDLSDCMAAIDEEVASRETVIE